MDTAAIAKDSRPQRGNKWFFYVSFPETWGAFPDEEPVFAGTRQKMSYPTEDAATLALQGFGIRLAEHRAHIAARES